MGNSESLQRIEDHFVAFREKVDECKRAKQFVMADWQDAYSRLYRLRERYIHERPNLTKEEQAALDKVFEHDSFTQGMMNARTVGDHVKDRGGPVLYTRGNAPVQLTAESSAMAIFSGVIAVVTDVDGNKYTKNHPQDLDEMVRRLEKAMQRAKQRDE